MLNTYIYRNYGLGLMRSIRILSLMMSPWSVRDRAGGIRPRLGRQTVAISRTTARWSPSVKGTMRCSGRPRSLWCLFAFYVAKLIWVVSTFHYQNWKCCALCNLLSDINKQVELVLLKFFYTESSQHVHTLLEKPTANSQYIQHSLTTVFPM